MVHDDTTATRDAIIRAALDAGDAAKAVARSWPADLSDPTRVRLIAIGKASLEMAQAVVDQFGVEADRLNGIVAAVPERIAQARLPSSIRVYAADHPLPTRRNLLAAQAIERFVQLTPSDQSLLVLISGGGSAHLCTPWDGLTLDDLSHATDSMLRAGATIDQLNMVRKHCERLKGGRLASLAPAVPIRALILSDVPGDHLPAIASGPLAPDPTTFADALDTLAALGLTQRCPAIVEHLKRGVAGTIPQTPKPGDPIFDRVSHTIIANNEAAVDAAVGACQRRGMRVVDRRTGVRGEAAVAGRALARALIDAKRTARPPIAIVWGGETTVRVGNATGIGGRNQELAVACAIELSGHTDACAMTLATDGVDGPTDAAGALVTGLTLAHAQRQGIDLHAALSNHASHTALDPLDALIRTGPTGTNINDIAVAWSTAPGR